MSGLFGSTRTTIGDRYAVLAGETLTHTPLPGWQNATCHVVISPALGARFSQVLVTMQADGQCAGNTGSSQYFIYVIDGSASVLVDERRYRLEAGHCVYLPPGKDVQLHSGSPATRVMVLQKPYHPLPGTTPPAALVLHERDVKSAPLAEIDLVRAQSLLPDQPAFDMGMRLFSFTPGAAPPSAATRVVEQSLCLLRGQGLCRLNREWIPVQAGDVVWVGPYCPQWFVAVGKQPAVILVYSEVNRDPM